MKRLLAIVLLMLCAKQDVYSYDLEVGGIYYDVCADEMSLMVAKGEGYYAGCVVVPATVTYRGKLLPVVGISPRAFYNCAKLTSIALPSSIKCIGEQAFTGCRGLTELLLPDEVEEIGHSAFTGCRAMAHIALGSRIKRCPSDILNGTKVTRITVGCELALRVATACCQSTLEEIIVSQRYTKGRFSIGVRSLPQLKRIAVYTPRRLRTNWDPVNAMFIKVRVEVLPGQLEPYRRDATWGRFWDLVEVEE